MVNGRKLAYLQSTEPLTRRVFIKNPSKEFELNRDEYFELLKPLFGLRNSEDLRHKTLLELLTNDLNMQPTKADPSLYFINRLSKLIGINGSYVDELLRAETRNLKEIANRRTSVFVPPVMKNLHYHLQASASSGPLMVHCRSLR